MSNKDQLLLGNISPGSTSTAGDELPQGGRIILTQPPFSFLLLQTRLKSIILIMPCLVLLAVTIVPLSNFGKRPA